jgi:hypothetical protein
MQFITSFEQIGDSLTKALMFDTFQQLHSQFWKILNEWELLLDLHWLFYYSDEWEYYNFKYVFNGMIIGRLSISNITHT